MKNDMKDVFRYLEKNKLSVSSRSIHIVEKMDLNDKDTLLKVKEILDRYDDNPAKYPEHIMNQLRERLGVEEYDTSKDEEINNMSKNEVFAELLGWNGLNGWHTTIKGWIKEIYDIELE